MKSYSSREVLRELYAEAGMKSPVTETITS